MPLRWRGAARAPPSSPSARRRCAALQACQPHRQRHRQRSRRRGQAGGRATSRRSRRRRRWRAVGRCRRSRRGTHRAAVAAAATATGMARARVAMARAARVGVGGELGRRRLGIGTRRRCRKASRRSQTHISRSQHRWPMRRCLARQGTPHCTPRCIWGLVAMPMRGGARAVEAAVRGSCRREAPKAAGTVAEEMAARAAVRCRCRTPRLRALRPPHQRRRQLPWCSRSASNCCTRSCRRGTRVTA
mmetsp:Transcript_12615/g.29087  ORF Transcript_12615/g.29087 Transcript_12615/m.29087 type:complete len:246 (+) Transcript_12615:278-1015(+)